MRVISVRRLQEFWLIHPSSKPMLRAWNTLVTNSEINTPDTLQLLFPQVDYVNGLYVFNIGRSYRIIAAIHFNRQILYIRHVLTHADYDRGNWKSK